jgi:hypothetical protein
MPRNDRGVTTLVIIFIVSVILAGVAAFLVLRQHNAVSQAASPSARRPPPTAEATAYMPSLEFTDLRMSAAVNFLGDTVTYLDGNVTNKGTRAVRRLEVELNFVDPFRQLVLRETAHPLAGRAKPLQPGETTAFRVTFEHMPADWNQAPPIVKPVYLEF